MIGRKIIRRECVTRKLSPHCIRWDSPRTKSNPRTVLGVGLQPQNVLVCGGSQHAPDCVTDNDNVTVYLPHSAPLQYCSTHSHRIFASQKCPAYTQQLSTAPSSSPSTMSIHSSPKFVTHYPIGFWMVLGSNIDCPIGVRMALGSNMSI